MLENLYNIIEQSEDKVKVKFTEQDHPVFQAHFPDKPILPGFLQIDIIARILEDEIVAIKYSKFISHILPSDTVVYSIKREEKKRKIKVLKDSKKVSEIAYESK